VVVPVSPMIHGTTRRMATGSMTAIIAAIQSVRIC
jgi:hypothetical protein